MTDEELLRAMATGDPDALSVLYRRHSPWIAARLRRSASSRDLAEEALQDTFVAAWRSAAKYRGEGEVAGWLWGIARRRLVSLARRHGGQAGAALTDWDFEDSRAGPAEISLARDEARRLRAAVGRLPSDQRGAVEGVLEGRSVNEVADETGVAAGTVKSRLHRARSRLRGDLQR
jgi:RNA polymerase sigma-70 factor (ECF subfamily)